MVAAGAAVLFGVGDFLSGVASRRASPLSIMVVALGSGLAALGLAAIASGTAMPPLGDACWGVVAGVAGAGGSFAVLRGFRVGALAVVSPLASVTAAGVPLCLSVLTGSSLSALSGVGVATALAAAAVLARGMDGRTARGSSGAGAAWGVAAGACHATMYLALGQSVEAGLGTATCAAGGTAGVAVVALVVGRERLALPPGARAVTVAAGLLGAAGTLAFVAATDCGDVGIAAVVAETSPAVTAVLATIVLRERLGIPRAVALAGTILAVGLITIG